MIKTSIIEEEEEFSWCSSYVLCYLLVYTKPRFRDVVQLCFVISLLIILFLIKINYTLFVQLTKYFYLTLN